MNKTLLLLLFLPFFGIGQISFDKGYLIDNKGIKTECLIKNIDKKVNPVSFEYKLNEKANEQIGSLENIQEFGITGFSKFERHLINVDLSSNLIGTLDTESQPIYEKLNCYLSVVLEGKAKLFEYNTKNSTVYFYQNELGVPEQLIYKLYKSPSDEIYKNMEFKQQLWNHVKLKNENFGEVKDLKFEKNDLISYFKKYNTENGGYDLTLKKAKGGVGMKLIAGVSAPKIYRDPSFGSKLKYFGQKEYSIQAKPGVIIGTELIYTLPFKRNKYQFYISPTFQTLQTTATDENAGYNLNYSFINFPIGFRNKFFLNHDNHIFTNVQFVLGGVIDIGEDAKNYKVRTKNTHRSNVLLGVGYGYKKHSLEIKYSPMNDIYMWKPVSKYSAFMFMYGYRIK